MEGVDLSTSAIAQANASFPDLKLELRSVYDDLAADSVFYMAANVEENYLRTPRLGNKPVYAYEWLRYHNSNWRIIPRNRELDPYFIEAMAILPYFSGAKGIAAAAAKERFRRIKHWAGFPVEENRIMVK